MAERRKLTRFAVSAPVRLTVGSGGATASFDVHARDVSAGGAYIYFDDPRLSVGDVVEVEIRLPVSARSDPAGGPLEIPMVGRGEIRRMDGAGLGVAVEHQLRCA